MCVSRSTLPVHPVGHRRPAGTGRCRPGLCALVLLLSQSACSTVDLKRITYEMLAQADCVRNQLDDFCARGYTHEYQEYERVRLDYLRNLADENDSDPETLQ